MPLPLINKQSTVSNPLLSKVKGAKTAPSGTLPQVLMKKPSQRSDVTKRTSAQIIQFPTNRTTRMAGQQANAFVSPKKKGDCCEQSQDLLKQIKSVNEEAVQSSKSENNCCEESSEFLKDISKTLKSMHQLQTMQFTSDLESSRENKDKAPGLGGFLEARKDDAMSFGKLVGDIIGVGLLLTIKPLMKLWEGATKMFDGAVKAMGDAIGNFGKAVGDWLKGLGDWWSGLTENKNAAESASARKPTVTDPKNTMMDTGQLRAKQDIRSALERQGIKDPKAVSNIMAQVKAESGFVNMSETSYKNTSNERIRKVFGDKVKDLSEEQLSALKKDDSKFFDKVYGDNKWLGNKEAGDAYKYRGRGYIQLTGRANYERIGKMIGADLINNPDLMNNPAVSARALAAYMKDKQNKGTNLKDITAVTKAVGPRDMSNAIAQRAALADQYLKTDYSGVIAKTKSIQSDAVKSAVPPKPAAPKSAQNNTTVVQGGQSGPAKAPPVIISSPDRGRSPIDSVVQFRQ